MFGYPGLRDCLVSHCGYLLHWLGMRPPRTSRLQSAPLSISGSKAGEPALAPSLPAPCWCGSPGLHSLATFSYGQGVILQGCFPSLCCVGGEQSLVFGMQRRQLHRVGGYGGRFPCCLFQHFNGPC